jgi:D-amino-acid dehydrogenase
LERCLCGYLFGETRMNILILGAGVIGTTSAWYLAKSGHDVTVIDRQPGAGLETSFANGGQISVSHAEPWANPSAPIKIMQWLAREDAPLLFRLRADPAQWMWGLRFLRECMPARARHNIAQIVNLGLYSRASLRELRRETGIEYDHLEHGILHFYTSQRELDAALEPTRLMRELGCDRQIKTPDECVAIEPALAGVRDRLVGATYTPSDESGDAHRFTQGVAALAAQAGVNFRYGTTVLGLEREGDALSCVRLIDAAGRVSSLRADAFVVALGSYSAPLLRSIGIRVPIYPAKGYSVTMDIADASRTPTVSLTDDEYKLVYSRLGDRLRIAGTAELNGYDMSINEARCQAIVKRTIELFPGAGRRDSALFWTGLRPATPSNVPLIGRSRYPNLYLNTGHGTLGWTHACGSARALADLVSGRRPEVDFGFLGMQTPAARPAMTAVRA